MFKPMEFWNAFWPSLASGVTTSILFTGIILWVVREYRKPKTTIALRFGHHAPSSNKKTLMFYLINNGRMTLESNSAHCFIYFELMTFQAFNTERNLPGVSADTGPYHLLEAFNEKPCHPGSEVEIASITTNMASPFPYEWVDESALYVKVFTSRGQWKPRWFSEASKQTLEHQGKILGYKITSVIV